MNDFYDRLNYIINLVKELGFEDVSHNEVIKFEHKYESNTYHRHHFIISITPLYTTQIIYAHSWGYGLENARGYNFDVEDGKDNLALLIRIENYIKDDFKAVLRKKKIQKLL